MLPLPAYTHPHSAPLNLATMIPGWANPSDLGPKTYIANGQVRNTGGRPAVMGPQRCVMAASLQFGLLRCRRYA